MQPKSRFDEPPRSFVRTCSRAVRMCATAGGAGKDHCPSRTMEHSMLKFAGKKAVISGGTHGMGLATARALLDGGAEVLLTGRNERNVDAVRRELGDRAMVVRSDVSNMADVRALGDLVQERLGAVDFLHVNAGISELGPFSEVTEETYDRVFSINTKGAFFTAQRLLPFIRQGGSIVFTTVTDAPASGNLSVY